MDMKGSGHCDPRSAILRRMLKTLVALLIVVQITAMTVTASPKIKVKK